MDTPQRIGTIIAIAIVVAYCSISDVTRYDRASTMLSEIETLKTRVQELQAANNRIRIFLAARGESERVLSSLEVMPFLSTLSDDQVSAIMEVLAVMPPQTWAHELEEKTTLTEPQIQWLVEVLEPR